jgi:D-cysteine desulfhydrase
VALPYPERIPLVQLPTTLERVPRLEPELGRELWIKRDDRTDVLLTGNKSRKLEFVLADAVAAGADVLVAGGGPQSNLIRVTTLAGARLGMGASLVVGTKDPATPPRLEGNLLLCHLAGASMRHVSFPELLSSGPALFEAVAAELRRAGRRPYIVPLAANGPFGIWGYVRALEELAAQLPPGPPPTIVYPVASGGTGAGLLLGLKLLGLPWRALGVLTTFPHEETRTRQNVLRFIEDARSRFKLSVSVSAEEVLLVDGSGQGYSVLGPAEIDWMREVARREGMVLDPIYNAKGFLTLRALARAGDPRLGARLVYLNTGGIYGLFAYGDVIAAAGGPA